MNNSSEIAGYDKYPSSLGIITLTKFFVGMCYDINPYKYKT
jgi:hypothetical protein